MRSRKIGATALVAITLPCLTEGHTWVESLRNIASNGSFVGPEGFPRGFQSRSDPAFTDVFQTYQIENGHGDNPTLCNPHAQGPNSQGKFPRLKATPGSAISLLYQENGHVTLPDTNPGKPANRGTIYIYATQQGKDDEKYFDVYQRWNIAGTGGDKRGKLISTQNYDDGQCFQVNGGKISQERQAATKFQPSDPMGTNLWCQNNIMIPTDVDTSKILSLYWVWKWDTAPGVDPNDKSGKNQTYTSCMDIDLQAAATANSKATVQFKYTQGQDPQKGAVSSIFEELKSGNVFVVKDGSEGTASSAATSSTAATQVPSATSSAPSVVTTSAAACSTAPPAVASTLTVFVFGTSTGTLAPTATGLSSSTAGQGQGTKTKTEMTMKTVTSLTTTFTTAPLVATSATSSASLVSQISDGQVQASGPQTSAPAQASSQAPAASASALSGIQSVVPVPTDPSGSFTFNPSATTTATASAIQFSSAGTTTDPTAVVASSSTSATAPEASVSASGDSKCGTAKRISKIFAPVAEDSTANNRVHPREWLG